MLPDINFNPSEHPLTLHSAKLLQRPSNCLDLHPIHHYDIPTTPQPPLPSIQSPGYAARVPSQLPPHPYALLLASPRRPDHISNASNNYLRTSYAHPASNSSTESLKDSAYDGHNYWREAERRHVCNKCQKRFDRPSSLRTHEHTHTGLKRKLPPGFRVSVWSQLFTEHMLCT